MTAKRGDLYFWEYAEAVKRHYPDAVKPDEAMTDLDRKKLGWLAGPRAGRTVVAKAEESKLENSNRFQLPSQRLLRNIGTAWRNASLEDAYTIRCGYKGLLNWKTPYDLVLYSNLLWELQPRTIIEFGALQGGSALWFADQLDVMCGEGEVHSFERAIECVSPRARHPRLHFHQVNLLDLATLDRKLFRALPHPWLVVDDAHADVPGLFALMSEEFMQEGDYFVIEDILARYSLKNWTDFMSSIEREGFVVDSRYTDAFGYNMTCAPNAWLMKK